MIGDRVSRYRILAPLGAGGMGEVWRARDEELGREVAVKVLPEGLAGDGDRLRRFAQEARAAAALNHPHIVAVYDVGELDGRSFIVTELLEGETLRARIQRRDLTQRQALEFGLQVVRGLAAAHAKGILHRDLKPENVFVTTAGEVKILDFGLAKLTRPENAPAGTSGESVDTASGVILGTVGYMAPEQLRGGEVDHRADLFSVGVMLYEMLAGRRPFARPSGAEEIGAILSEEVPPLREASGVAPAVARLVESCLEKRPEQRLGSARDLALALAAVTPEDLRMPPPEAAAEPRPYPGLAPFTEADAEVFFGREAEVEAVWEVIRQRPQLAIIGPSGAGKSSFVRAGLLAHSPPGWATAVCHPATAPQAALARALVPGLAGDTEALSRLVDFADPAVAVEVVTRWRQHRQAGLVVVDQLEELFTLNPPETQRTFAALLGRLPASAGVHVLLVMRDDFLFRCHEHPGLDEVFEKVVPLGPPAAEDLLRAITEPAHRLGYQLEDDALAEDMVAEVEGERSALPLLAFAASRLWEERDRERKLLTREAYDRIGHVAGALARHAEATVQRIGSDRLPLVRELFRNLVTAQGTRAVLDREEVLSVFSEDRRDDAGQVLDQLVDARLLTTFESEEADGSRHHRVEIVHESLLESWPRLVRWQTQDADAAQLRDQLRQAARLWDDHGRTPDLLWTGTTFREYSVWRERYPGGLSELEEAFATSMTAHAKRRRQRRRVAAAAAFVILLAVLSVVASSRQRAVHEARRAEAAKLIALGQVELATYPTAALAWATASLELADTPEARLLALRALWRGPPASILPLPPGDWWTLDLSPDGRWLAAGSLIDEVRVFPSSGGAPLVLGGHAATGYLRRVRFSPSSDLLATKCSRTETGQDDPLFIWSIPQGELVRRIAFEAPTWFAFDLSENRLVTFTEDASGGRIVRKRNAVGDHETTIGRLDLGPTSAAVLDPTGHRLALARGRDLVLRELDDAHGAHERVLGSHTARITHLACSSDGQILSKDESGEIRVWSTSRDHTSFRRLFADAAKGWRGYVRIDATGTTVAAVVKNERSIYVWDLGDPPDAEPLKLRRSDAPRIEQIDIATAGGKWLVVSNGSSASFWPLSLPHLRELRGHLDTVYNVEFSPDGRWIATGSADGTVRVWPLHDTDEGSAGVLVNEDSMIYGVAVDPEGTRVLITRPEHAPVIQPLDGGPPLVLEPAVGAPGAVAFDLTGRRVAVGAGYSMLPEERVIRIWDSTSGELLQELDLLEGRRGPDVSGPYDGGVYELEFAPDGRLYSSRPGVRRWDLLSGTAETLVASANRMDISRDGRVIVVAQVVANPPTGGVAQLYEAGSRTLRPLLSHGPHVCAVALDPTGSIVVTGDANGTVRAGGITGEEPHLMLGHEGHIADIAVSPDGRWIASGGADGTLRLWPMPDMSKPPLHTLPHDELIGKLKTVTNLRVVRDGESASGWKLTHDPFPGWETVPTW